MKGLQLKCGEAGKSWQLWYRANGRERRPKIGDYPTLSLDAARRTARELLAQVSSGRDPSAERQAARKAADAATVGAVAARWLAERVTGLAPGTADLYNLTWRVHIAPRFGSLPLAGLARPDVARMLRDMSDTPSAANTALRVLNACLSWAIKNELVPAGTWPHGNPAAGHSAHTEAPSTRILSVLELRLFLAGVPAMRAEPSTKAALMLQILTGQRGDDVVQIARAEIDERAAVWTCPRVKTKNGLPHTVPLGPWSREVLAPFLAATRRGYLFPSGSGHLDQHALTTAVAREQRQRKPAPRVPCPAAPLWAFTNRDGDASTFSPHDLRRTVASYLELTGVPTHVRGAILNHKEGRSVTEAHYSAAELLALKRRALLDWEAALRTIVAGGDPFAAAVDDFRRIEAEHAAR